ncbi:MAG: LysM peptidoglycan-binding domain-containing M23 family metallopeptidase [Bacillota bacterium]
MIGREKQSVPVAGAENILKYSDQFISFIKRPKEPAAIIGVAVYTIVVMFLVSMINAGNMSWGVYSGDRLIATVNNPAEAREVIGQLTEESSDAYVVAALERLYLKKTGHTGNMMTGGELKAALGESITSRVKGTEVVVDGKALIAMRSRAEAEQLLKELKDAYAIPGGKTAFVEDVKLNDTMVEKIKIVSVDRALDMVKNGTRKKATYQVKDGDTLWGIASRLGVPVDKLIAANPGFNPDRLGLGDVLSLERAEPLINVETILAKSVTEQYSAPVEEKKDSSLYLGERRVVAQGQTGKREVIYQITERNGIETDRKIIREDILEEARPKVVATGTRVLLASRGGGGRLGWPLSGPISSPFGPRGGGMHTGLDIEGYTGAPVVAAESGTVTMAQWYAGYGKCVDISHGEGVVTRYSHLSAILVEVGQKVDRGELVGKVGTTGYATGPHLHFEVIINGTARNPLNYL